MVFFGFFFLCSYVTEEAVKCRGRLFSKNLFNLHRTATYSGKRSSVIRCVSFRKKFSEELLLVVHIASSGIVFLNL